MIIGSHVSFANEQLLGSVKEALSYKANTFMFYTGAPTNTIRKDINNDLTEKAVKLMKENMIDINNVICHAPYIVNLANKSDISKYEFSIEFIKNELKRCDLMGITKIVLHPGSAVGISKEEGLNNICEALNKILDDDTKCQILIETMAGKGSECGSKLEEISYILKNVVNKERMGVCLDTCHLFDSGYDISDFDDFLKEFDSIIGINSIGCIHINDSKNEIGSCKDRHANIGFGYIGFDNLINIIYHDKLKDIPKILETPYIGESDDDKSRIYPPYLFEIEMIKNKEFDKQIFAKIRNHYQ